MEKRKETKGKEATSKEREEGTQEGRVEDYRKSGGNVVVVLVNVRKCFSKNARLYKRVNAPKHRNIRLARQ